MKSILVLVLSIGISFAAFGDEDHSSDVCSAADAKVCAHIGHMKNMKPNKSGEFVAHVMAPDEISDLKVELWMPAHDHGSTPVKLNKKKKNKYQVKEAKFSMPGAWEVRLAFNIKGAAHTIAIPVEIK